MNFTVLSLVSPLLLANSPVFSGNRLNVINTKFSKFFPLLFYNQQSLFLKKSTFSQGLSGIIYNNVENRQFTLSKEQFNDTNYETDLYNEIKNLQNESIIIYDCFFNNISKSNLFEGSPILIRGNISVYMTENIFNSCKSQQGVIKLKRCRCVTITHTCSYESSCESGYAFLYNDCVEEDFSIFIYNTIADSKSSLGGTEISNYFSKSGNQYIKCINMTGVPFNAFDYDFPICFTFSMNTVMNCQGFCFKLSGSTNTSKMIENVNFFNNGSEPLIVLSNQNGISLTIINSVLLSDKANIVRFALNSKSLVLINCIITDINMYRDRVKTTECSTVQYDTNYLTQFPHYTRDPFCKGPENINTNAAFGCNAGNCFENDNSCNHTIGFPEGVPRYSTIIHTDLQTASFTPTQQFSHSSQFTKSDDFTNSIKFTSSEHFTPSSAFSKTDCFTKSDIFSMSDEFTESNVFTQSNIFTSSDVFSKSNTFTVFWSISKSNCFTKSDSFKQSKEFSNSLEFSPSSHHAAVNVGENSGKNNKKMIGIIAGTTGAVAATAAALAAFFIIKGHRGVQVEDLETIDNDKKNVVSVNNDLGMMEQDDPFADDFANH